MRGRWPCTLIRRWSSPVVAALLGLGLVASAEATPGAHGAVAGVAPAVAVSAPVAASARDRGERREGTRAGRRSRSRAVYRPYYGSFGRYGGFGAFWPYYFSPYAFGRYGPYAWGPGPAGYAAPNAGALDINTKPKKASVYLDGELIGRVGSFDGFPGYLWLREGSYRLAIFMEGHETLERSISVHPGLVIKIDEDLAPGAAVQPQPAAPALVAARAAERTGPSGEPWRVEKRGQPIEQDQRSEPARLMVEVQPADAVVYLDGRLLGSGAQLANLHSPLIIDPGAHRLEVTRPGYASAVRAFEATKSEDISLRIELRQE
jgi:hypothetical protein